MGIKILDSRRFLEDFDYKSTKFDLMLKYKENRNYKVESLKQ
tara:strand:- start:214 stop:339 length:126 start_codon:yes stop_codon:yes gene_type:complete